MRIEVIRSKHFVKRWRERVGEEYRPFRMQKLINASIKAGNLRRQEDGKLGVMLPITTDKRIKVYLTGYPIGPTKFLLKTVLDEQMARKMEWIR